MAIIAPHLFTLILRIGLAAEDADPPSLLLLIIEVEELKRPKILCIPEALSFVGLPVPFSDILPRRIEFRRAVRVVLVLVLLLQLIRSNDNLTAIVGSGNHGP